jgi:YD repeat-containing protein
VGAPRPHFREGRVYAMPRKPVFGNKRLFYSWLLSYISILTIPLIVSGIVSFASVRAMTDETEAAIEATLRQVRFNIDEKVTSYWRMAYQVNHLQDMPGILGAGETFTNLQYYNLIRIRRNLDNMIGASRDVDGVFLFHRNSGRIISAEHIRGTELFYANFFHPDFMAYGEMLGMLNASHGLDFKIIQRLRANGEPEEVMALLTSLPLLSGPGEPRGTLMITIPAVNFQTVLNNLRWMDDYELLIIDGDGRLLMSNGPEYVPAGEVWRVAGFGAGGGELTLGGRRFEVTRMKSEVTDWTYAIVTPADVLWRRTQYVRTIALVSMILCTMAGGVVAFFFMRRHQKPIAGMVAEIQYAYKTLEKQNLEIKHASLRNLLKGLSGDGSDPDPGDSEPRAVLLARFDSYDAFKAAGSDDPDGSALRLAWFALGNVLEELLGGKGHTGSAVEVDGTLACVVSFRKPDAEGNARDLDGVARECKRYFADQLGADIAIAISGVHEGPSGVPTAYGEACDVMEFGTLKGYGGVLSYKNIKTLSDGSRQLGKMVAEYIQAHYADPNLSVSFISGTFNFARQHLSTLFKAQMGQPLTDYLSKVRLDRAKLLLRNDGVSVKEAAALVGYSNSTVFIRTFRKYEGITPGEYRDIYHSS